MKRYALLSAALAVAVPGTMLAGQVNLQDQSPGTQQIGHINVSGNIRAGTIIGYSTQPTDIAYGGDFRSVSTQGRGVLGNASSPIGVTYGGLFQSASNQGRGIAGITSSLTGPTVGGFFTTNSINGKGVQGSSNATSGLNYGVYGRNVSPNGFALYGEGNGAFTGNLGVGTGIDPVSERLVVAGNAAITGTIAGNGSLLTDLNASALTSGTVSDSRLGSNVARRDADNSFLGFATFQKTLDNSTLVGAYGNGNGQHGFDSILNGSNCVAMMGFANGSGGTGVRGTGGAFGVYGIAANPAAFGVYSEGNVGITGSLGIGTGTTSPTGRLQIVDDNNATAGTVHITNGSISTTISDSRAGLTSMAGGTGPTIGVQAVAESTSSTTWGLYGAARGTGFNYGVFGHAENGTNNFAGYFNGNLFAVSANAGIKAFMIDHPMDPANKVLMHSSVESDERKNIYDGVVVTDGRGYATVTMPTWFEALNEDFRYQLTVIDNQDSGSFTLAKVVQEVKNGKFRLRTSEPNSKVSWQVTGRRHDPTSNYYPLEVERMKTKDERGKYYVPEAYGKDPSLGIAHRASSTRSPAAK